MTHAQMDLGGRATQDAKVEDAKAGERCLCGINDRLSTTLTQRGREKRISAAVLNWKRGRLDFIAPMPYVSSWRPTEVSKLKLSQLPKANLFTYGSLMFPAVWQQLVPHPRNTCLGFVAQFSRRLIFMDSYPVLIPDASCTGVLGRIYSGLNANDLARLDEFEGEIYHRITLDVFTESGVIVCQTYTPKQCFQALTRQNAWRGDLFNTLELPVFLSRYCRKNLPKKQPDYLA